MQITTIGLDIAKNVFQVHGSDASEKIVVRKQLRRGQMLAFFEALPPCLIGMEACATAHYWARELTKLGHQVRLMPARDVKAYVKRNKNDAADAEAICEAVRRPTMRFVQIKSVEQQGQLMLHRARDLLMRQRTQLINALRAHMAELGIVAAQGGEGLKELLKIIASEQDARLPLDAHASLVVLAAGLQAMQTMIGSIERRIIAQHRSDEASKRLRSIPGIGIVGATAIAATVPDPKVFRSGRDFAAWIGIVPREDSTGGKHKLGPISKRGDQYLRRILVVGAHAVLKRARHQPEKYPWVTRLLERKPFRVVAVAVANKMARVAWALLARGGSYRAPAAALLSRLALEAGLPTVCEWASMAHDGCLLGYGPNFAALWRVAAEYVARILRGEKPGELPIEQPTLFEFAVNLKTAKALGLTIPEASLLRADEVIE